tara:strand:- start:23422 stop:24363 length:942 start_codon:yes stop_codon:yes gene_type:complete
MRSATNLNLVLPTLGGQGLWTDHATRAGWRLQVHALTGHARLLDTTNRRRAWGSRAAVSSALFNQAPTATQRPQHVVVLVHGLGGNSLTFRQMRKALRTGGYAVAEFKYASALTQISAQAEALRTFIDGLDTDSITLVGQSMGGLVADRVLSFGTFRDEIFHIGRTRVCGILRIGTPCGGSAFARAIVAVAGLQTLKRTPLAAVATGLPADAVSDRIPHLNIAGSLNGARGLNPLIAGPDDGLVGVAEVSRGGFARTLIVNASHYGLTSNQTVIKAVLAFCAKGKTLVKPDRAALDFTSDRTENDGEVSHGGQ